MLEATEIVEDLIAFLQPKPLRGKRVLITAGPTAEPIDPVRVLTNHSSGKMGYAVARAAHEAGAEVILVSGPTALPTPRGVLRLDVDTAEQMLAQVRAEVPHTDVFIAVAAVADWRVKHVSAGKLKKNGDVMPVLEFELNPDILATVAALPNAPYCVGFAAETDDMERQAAEKRVRKGVPLLVGNIAQQSFGADESVLTLFDERGAHPLPRLPKLAGARQLVEQIAQRLGR